ncbi:Holliday junction resolvase RuvX [Chondrinema litorale]|uniref:Holliday junction resolvase RuvX n=1 Tax=Chondrinema litorale TaxID=2994555 RepID=UPI002544227B|nr:Holliday junction resolvase RuvX [Chondrinema litorale]UZR93084.1 Holliday junction resolvase RuvX [Chondrinema litorale]
MARILAIDYGKKRTGIAVTDELQIIANALDTVPTENLIKFLTEYFKTQNVESIVLGMPKNLDQSETHATPLVLKFKEQLTKLFPEKKIFTVDERFTSRMAVNAMVAGGMKKKDRKNKSNIDKISAVIILQSFMDSKDFLQNQ